MSWIQTLVDSGAVSPDQLDAATAALAEHGGALAGRLVDIGVPYEPVMSAMSEESGLPVASTLDMARASRPDDLEGSPMQWADAGAVPIGQNGARIRVAVASPESVDAVAALLSGPFEAVLALEADVRTVQKRLFGGFEAIPATTTDPEFSASFEQPDEGFDGKTEAIDLRSPLVVNPNAKTLTTKKPPVDPSVIDELPPGLSGFEDDAPTIALTAQDLAAPLASDRTQQTPALAGADLLAGDLAGMSEEAAQFEDAATMAVVESLSDLPGGSADGEDLDAPTVARSSAELLGEAMATDNNDAVDDSDGDEEGELELSKAELDEILKVPIDHVNEPKTAALSRDELLAMVAERADDRAGSEDEAPSTMAFSQQELLEMASRGEPALNDDASSVENKTAALSLEELRAMVQHRQEGGDAQSEELVVDDLDSVVSSEAVTGDQPSVDAVDGDALEIDALEVDALEVDGSDEGDIDVVDVDDDIEVDALEDLPGGEAPGTFDEPTFAMDAKQLQVSLEMLKSSGDGVAVEPPSEAPAQSEEGLFDEPTLAAPGIAERATMDAVAALAEAGSLDDTGEGEVLPESPTEMPSDAPSLIVDVSSPATDIVDDSEIIEIDDFEDGTEVLSSPLQKAIPRPRQAAPLPPSEPSAPSLSGAPEISGYQIIDVLGEGGMATVYRAKDLNADREVALKVMSPELSDDETFVERFKRETRSVSSLRSEHVLRVYDYGNDGDHWFMSTEIMDGGTLRDLVKTYGPVPVPLALVCFDRLLRGLSTAHEHGITHRDIKPGNIMLSSTGGVKIGDFGIAKMDSDDSITRTGALFGTPAYMSPEQTLGRPLDGRSDLFSAGVILLELLAGYNPYVADSPQATLLRVSRAGAPPVLRFAPGIPKHLSDLCERIGKRDPRQRFQDAEEVLQALQPLVERCESAFPTIVQDYVASPKEALENIKRQVSRDALVFSRSQADNNLERSAAYWAYASHRMCESNGNAKIVLDQLCKEYGMDFAPTTDPRIRQAEADLEETPDDAELLLKVIGLYERNPHLRAAHQIHYLRKNDDPQVEANLSAIFGDDPFAPLRPAVAEGPMTMPLPSASPQVEAPAPAIRALPVSGEAPPAPAPFAPPQAANDPNPLAGYGDAANDPVVAALMEDMKRKDRSQQFSGMQIYGTAPGEGVKPPSLPPRPSLNSRPPQAAAPIAPSRQKKQGGGGAKAALIVSLILVLLVGAGAGGWWFFLRGPAISGPPEVRQAAYFERGNNALQSGDFQQALIDFNEAVKIDPNSQTALNTLLPRAKAHIAAGNSNFARADLERLVETLPEGNLIRGEAASLLSGLE